ncbi:MAG: glycerol acyltransferase [Brachymonas sp.]|nr:glycerol acyltransferase [Brachymonas sp.]
MHLTIFQTPVVSQVFRAIFWVWRKLLGWRVMPDYPEEARRCVMIAAPHTSNWDLPMTLMGAFYWRLNIYWLGKQSIFKFPFGAVMRWLGGVAVDRSKSNNLTQNVGVALAALHGQAQLIVPPEGTRGKVTEWKTGFYYIAQAAQLPILLAYVDYEKKEIGHFGIFTPTGDVQADISRIRALYAQVKGKHP